MQKLEASRILLHSFGARITALNGQMVLAVPGQLPEQFHEFRKAVDVLEMDSIPVVPGHSFAEPMFSR